MLANSSRTPAASINASLSLFFRALLMIRICLGRNACIADDNSAIDTLFSGNNFFNSASVSSILAPLRIDDIEATRIPCFSSLAINA